MKQMLYMGPRQALRGYTSLVQPSELRDGKALDEVVMCQFDRAPKRLQRYMAGWHPFDPASFRPYELSPYETIQELQVRDRHYPWRVLVCCALLNQTHGRQVRPMIDRFFDLVPDPEAMTTIDADTELKLLELLKPLGFVNRRFRTLVRMTRGYVERVTHPVLALSIAYSELYGVGPYAMDAIDLFVNGTTNCNPHDTWLRPYKAWREAGGPMVVWDIDGFKRIGQRGRM